MSRSAWKFLKTNQRELYAYNQELQTIKKHKGLIYFGHVYNTIIFNNINYMFRYTFHLGKYYVQKKFYQYVVKSTGLDFLKFKKPFNFTPKKKKKK